MWELITKGEARDVYVDDSEMQVILVASDKMSAFDQDLGVSIAGKGRMLTKISKHWFEVTDKIVPNAYCALKRFDELFSSNLPDGVDPEATIRMFNLRMLPVEVVVRGYLTGDAWTAYENGLRELCGVRLPNGIHNSEELKDPIFMPTSKKIPGGGMHSQLTFGGLVEHLKYDGVMGAYDRAQIMMDYSLRLYKYAHAKLREKNIILAETKFEFGINQLTGNIMLADEAFTPDSSRFWDMDHYALGGTQKSLDKQIIRDWVKDHPGQKVPQEVIEDTAVVYNKITEILTSVY